MLDQQLIELQRSVAVLTERSENTTQANNQLQKQNEALLLKLDLVISQISQINIENIERHMGLKVSLRNKLTRTSEEIKGFHQNDITCLKNNVMVKIGESKRYLTAIAFVVLVSFWQNVEGIIKVFAKMNGISMQDKPRKNSDEQDSYKGFKKVSEPVNEKI